MERQISSLLVCLFAKSMSEICETLIINPLKVTIMKKLLLIIFAFICLTASAQEYKPMFTDGKMWIYSTVVIGQEFHVLSPSTSIAVVCGDTIVGAEHARSCVIENMMRMRRKRCLSSTWSYTRSRARCMYGKVPSRLKIFR